MIGAGMMMPGAEHARMRINSIALARGEQAAAEEHRVPPPILDRLLVTSCTRIIDTTPFACLHHVPVRACSPARSPHSYTHVSIAPGPLRQRQPDLPPDYDLPVTGIRLDDGNPPLRQLQPRSHHPLVHREM